MKNFNSMVQAYLTYCFHRSKYVNSLMLLNELKWKEEIHKNILGLPTYIEEESEVKVTEEDLGLIKFIIEENIKNLSTYKTIKASFIGIIE